MTDTSKPRDPWSYFGSGGGGGGGLGASSNETATAESSGGSASYTQGGGFNSESDFPEWLQKPNMDELENEYAGIDQYFNIGKQVRPMKKFAEAQYSNALQQGAGAADEAIARAFQTGIVGPVNTTMISAQTAMPALLAKMGAQKDIAGIRINNMYKEQQARAGLAAQIAGMRKQYVDTMAQYALGQDRLGLESELGHARLDLSREQLDFDQDRYADQQEASQGPSYGELAAVMSSYNGAIGSPQALNYWQQFGAGLGGYADNKVNIGFGGAVGAGGGGYGMAPLESDLPAWLR